MICQQCGDTGYECTACIKFGTPHFPCGHPLSYSRVCRACLALGAAPTPTSQPERKALRTYLFRQGDVGSYARLYHLSGYFFAVLGPFDGGYTPAAVEWEAAVAAEISKLDPLVCYHAGSGKVMVMSGNRRYTFALKK